LSFAGSINYLFRWRRRGAADYFTFSNAAISPSVVCSLASIVGFNPSAVMALLVSGPMEASFSCGNEQGHHRAWIETDD